jgi:glycosyltransferase involved in cell wall biosynthesis
MKIMFLTRSMAIGGAQRQLLVLCKELLARGHEISVLLYYAGDPFDSELMERGVRIIDLDKRGRWRNLSFLMRLIRAVRTGQPDVVHAYLPGPNLLALLLRYLGGGCAIACGVRASEMSSGRIDWLARLILRLERRLVPLADVVIVNSGVGAKYVRRGKQLANVFVINNGIETRTFSFDEDGRRRMRDAWNATASTPIVGCVARLDPMKDHATLLRGFALLRRTQPNARLICVGTFAEPYLSELHELARQLQLAEAVRWVERESQLRDLYCGLDVLCLSSAYGEGFPNVLAEAMACGVPCVTTDVGDAASIISAADFLVPPRDPEALAQALGAALAQGRAFSQLRVERVRTLYSPRILAEKTELALNTALERRNARVTCGGAT